ncbi:hypothetical protein [Burkholderia sp. Tr-20390]|uniref:hypothetical protein n=1 Tax=Burkholderia sp. Tr-20390 TaxID=2703904 RepID=UPI00197F1E2C|nr:hypothetical protein [Burkholderia sp. Tr-20390]MBN3729394.1 hypothetical protein [Burkholderia sp. Tr-20390]
MIDISEASITELLSAHSALLDELRRRGITRSGNNPTGDYAEWLVATKLGLKLAGKSSKGFDATDRQSARYEIKGRRVTSMNRSTQLSPIRNLSGAHFDFLVAVVFDSTWKVMVAAKIPYTVVSRVASYKAHVNGHVIHVRPSLLSVEGVEDITALL